MKKNLAILLSLLIVFSLPLFISCNNEYESDILNEPPVPTIPESPVSDFHFIPNFDDGGVQILSYIGTSPFVRVPAIIEGEPVTRISSHAFFSFDIYDAFIEVVYMPCTITYIGDRAFGNNPKLNNIHIPNSVTHIGRDAFAHTNFTSVIIPINTNYIWSGAFANTSLTNVTIPRNVTRIEAFAFSFANLESVSLPSGLTYIGMAAFNDTNLTSIDIPNSVAHIGGDAFAFTNLSSVTIPNNVTYIGSNAFARTNLTSITIPSGVNYIGSNAFTDLEPFVVFFGGMEVDSIRVTIIGYVTEYIYVWPSGSIRS